MLSYKGSPCATIIFKGVTVIDGVKGLAVTIGVAGDTAFFEVPDINTGDNTIRSMPILAYTDFNGQHMFLIFLLSFGF